MRWLTNLLIIAALCGTAPAWATTYWVATTGSNANACSAVDGEADPGVYKLTIAGGATCLLAGDTLTIKAGTYAENFTTHFPSGTSWNSPTTVKAATGATVTIRPNAPANPTDLCHVFRFSSRQYIVLDGLIVDATNACANAIKIESTADHIRVRNTEIINAPRPAVLIIGSPSGISFGCCNEFISLNVHDNGTDGDFDNTFYVQSADNLIEYSDIHDNVGSGIAFSKQNSSLTQDNVARYNRIYNLVGNKARGIVTGDSLRDFIHHNLIFGNQDDGIYLFSSSSAQHNQKVQNNTIYNNGDAGVRIESTTQNADVRNNIVFSNLSGISGTGGGTPTISNNTTVDPSFVNAVGADFALQAGSAAINAGTDVGLGFNGSAPDTGAHETFVHASCAVEDATPTVINITFTNNVNPPLLPASSVTGFTARENAAAKTVSSVSRVGDNQMNVTVSAAFSGGTTIDYSYATASGNVTDSALIGGTKNQRLNAITNQSCTNNVAGGAPAHAWTQTYFSFYDFYGTESGGARKPHSAAAVNTNISIVPGGKFALRIKLACTGGDCPAIGVQPRFSRNTGAYTVIPDSFGVDNIKFFGNANVANVPTEGTATTERLTSDHATNVVGQVVRTSSAIPTVDLSQNSEIELLYYGELDSDVVVSDTFDVRLYKQDGTVLDTYTVTPRLTVIGMVAGSGM